ncbi:MAG: hypothetical protein BM564_03935 [Bacteroidetes bacterium MedPE-SWsnd-G2]|nr:MAG: hypothetical protein BM564_03935 [Bacteroidetes bacterium MedPE-SWsnd-G2]
MRFLLLAVLLVFFNCANEPKLIEFENNTIENLDGAQIDINYAISKTVSSVSDSINAKTSNYIISALDIGEETDTITTIESAVQSFNNQYLDFKSRFPDSAQQWEVNITTEANYQSEDLICIPIRSYIDTGGAHGNEQISFLNFNRETGSSLQFSDVITNENDFKTLAESHFRTYVQLPADAPIEDYFFGEGFKLPEEIGFNSEGVILLYNVYEIASYAQGITEFLIPYEEANPYLKYH